MKIKKLLALVLCVLLLVSCKPASHGSESSHNSSIPPAAEEPLDDAKLNEYLDRVLEDKAYFVGENRSAPGLTPTLLTFDSTRILCDHSDCSMGDNDSSMCSAGTMKCVAAGGYVYAYQSSSLTGEKYLRIWRFDLSDISSNTLEYILLDGIESEKYYITDYEKDFWIIDREGIEPTRRLELDKFNSESPEYIEYPGLTKEYRVLYCDTSGRAYCTKWSNKESIGNGFYVFEPDKNVYTTLSEDVEMYYTCDVYPGEGDSVTLYFLESNESCIRGYDLCQYSFSETANGVVCDKIVRTRNVLDFAICGGKIYALINDPDDERTVKTDSATFFDYSGSKLYSAPIIAGDFECVWQNEEYVIYGYSEYNVASKKNSVGMPLPTHYSAIIQSNFNGMIIPAIKEKEGRFIHTYILFDTTGGNVNVRYAEGNKAEGVFFYSFAKNNHSFFYN